jgi:integrase
MKGNTLEDAQIVLGHKSIKTTERYYAGFSEERKQKVRDALKRVRGEEVK